MSGKPQSSVKPELEEEFDNFDDHADLDEVKPAKSIQTAAEARRKLEEYWEKKQLKDQLKDLDDWDE